MKNKRIPILLAILCLVIIFGFISNKKEITLSLGGEVLLKTVPVDPRDLFKDNYIILHYKISTLDLDKIPANYTDFKINDEIYVSLKREKGYAVPARVYKNSPKAGLFLKGVVKDSVGRRFVVAYGIESYLLSPAKKEEAQATRRTSLDVKASIDSSGKATIKALLIDGKQLK